MSRNLIIVPITGSYLKEGETLLRSLLVHNPKIPVHVLSKNGEVDFLKTKYANVEIVQNEESCDSEFRQVRTSRFRHAADVRTDYDVVCLLDADMVSIRPMENIFKMAETGTILVSNNNTLMRYRHQHFAELGIEAPAEINAMHASFCTVPLFINPSMHNDFLYAVWDSSSGNDLDVPNLLSITMGLIPDLYYLPSPCWTGVHHSALKPETHALMTDDGLYSKTGEPIYMIHGHWGQPNYYQNQMIEPMIKNYGYWPPYIDCARECIKILKNEYDKYGA